MNQLGIFAKFWQPGEVKTRLGSCIGMKEAADVYQAMLRSLTDRLCTLEAKRELSIWPADRRAEFAQFTPTWTVTLQCNGDLGDKMNHYFRSAFASGAKRVILIGSDCPLLTKADLNLAFDKLTGHDVVLGPSEDGGYYLIGGTPAMPDVFSSMRWSTADVWPTTVERLTERDVKWAELETRFDVDDIDDLRQLMTTLADLAYQSEEWNGLRASLDRIGFE